VVEEGHRAPDFELAADDGGRVRLSDLHGRPVVVYFYPRDDTPGCTAEARAFRDVYDAFVERGAVVLGVSPDDEASHQRFKAKYGLQFRLLTDPEYAAARAYDVSFERERNGKRSRAIKRSTFVVASDGTVVKAMYGVRPEGHAADVLAALPS
jgi:thioredoxin-dependent peroxiredoxin